MKIINAITAIFCPIEKKLNPITDSEATQCKYFAYYTYTNGNITRTNCKFEKESITVLEVEQ